MFEATDVREVVASSLAGPDESGQRVAHQKKRKVVLLVEDLLFLVAESVHKGTFVCFV